MMFLGKLTVATTGVLAAGLLAGVGWLAAGERPAQDKPRGAAAPPAPEANPNEEADRATSRRNLRQIALGLNNFAVANRAFPPAAIRSPDGKPLLSWRVAILPHVGQEPLFQKFHLAEAWDSPHNKALLAEMPSFYAPVVDKEDWKNSTFYLAIVGPGAVFDGDPGTPSDDIADEPGNTLMVVEAAKPVPWTKPEDLPADERALRSKVGGQFAGGFHGQFVNGSVRFLPRRITPQTLRALITRAGGEAVDLDKLQP